MRGGHRATRTALHAAAETTLFNLTHLGCVIPPNADTYWVGDAGRVPATSRPGGEDHPYTSAPPGGWRTTRVHMARIMKANPIPAEGNTFDDETDPRPMHNG